MSYFTKYEMLCNEEKDTPTGVAIKLGISRSAVSRWRDGSIPSGEILTKLAEHFDVSADFLLDQTDIRNPINKSSPEEIAKVALFGGDSEVTDEMWSEVKNYVEYIKAKNRKD